MELSKRKYIYHVHSNGKDAIHSERFPIIYVNKAFCYFKKSSSAELSWISTGSIKDRLNKDSNIKLNCFKEIDQYCFNVNLERVDINKLYEKLYLEDKEGEIYRLRQKINNSKLTYERDLKALKDLQEQIEDEGEFNEN